VKVGSVMIVHQPVARMSELGRNEVIRSPTDGSSQMRPMSPSTMWIGLRAMKRVTCSAKVRLAVRVSAPTEVAVMRSPAQC
jgi:hypothetical protein